MAAALVTASCSDEPEATTSTTVAATTTTIVGETIVGDGLLSIGVLLPTADPLIGEPTVDAAQLAVERINDAGGVLDRRVRIVVADEGSTNASASAGLRTLLDTDVDAIIGPGSSVTTLGILDDIVSEGVLACSPTASAIGLDDFPDDGLFFRTIASDSLQARAIADAAGRTGAQRAAIAFVDDAYGRGLAASVEDALDGGPIDVIDRVPFTGRDDDLDDEAERILDAAAPVAIVLAGADDGLRMLESLDDHDTSGIASVFVNDALRNPAAPERVAGLDETFRTRVVGLGPQAEPIDDGSPPPTTDDTGASGELSGPFAAQAYDCVNLIALAAERAESDVPIDIAAQIPAVSTSGSSCRSFAECIDATDAGLEIDYDGPLGIVEIGRDGRPTRALFDRFVFDDEGRDVTVETVVAAS